MSLLVPRGDAPTMLLAMVIKETVAADGTTSVDLDRTYTICGRSRPSHAG